MHNIRLRRSRIAPRAPDRKQTRPAWATGLSQKLQWPMVYRALYLFRWHRISHFVLPSVRFGSPERSRPSATLPKVPVSARLVLRVFALGQCPFLGTSSWRHDTQLSTIFCRIGFRLGTVHRRSRNAQSPPPGFVPIPRPLYMRRGGCRWQMLT